MEQRSIAVEGSSIGVMLVGRILLSSRCYAPKGHVPSGQSCGRLKSHTVFRQDPSIDCLQHLPILQHFHYSMAPLLRSAIQNPQSAILTYLPNLTVILETAMAFASICFAAFAGAAARLPGNFSIFSA